MADSEVTVWGMHATVMPRQANWTKIKLRLDTQHLANQLVYCDQIVIFKSTDRIIQKGKVGCAKLKYKRN